MKIGKNPNSTGSAKNQFLNTIMNDLHSSF